MKGTAAAEVRLHEKAVRLPVAGRKWAQMCTPDREPGCGWLRKSLQDLASDRPVSGLQAHVCIPGNIHSTAAWCQEQSGDKARLGP